MARAYSENSQWRNRAEFFVEREAIKDFLTHKWEKELHYRPTQIQGIDIAYREAGDPSRPAIVLLHGFPISSHMYRELIPQLAKSYHVIAPDYPGFGASE